MVTAVGLMVSRLGSGVFLLFFDIWLVFLCYCLWFKAFGFGFDRFFCSMTKCIFFDFKAYGLRLSGLSFHVFFSFFD